MATRWQLCCNVSRAQKAHNVHLLQSSLSLFWEISPLVAFLGGQQHSRTSGNCFSSSFDDYNGNWWDTTHKVSKVIQLHKCWVWAGLTALSGMCVCWGTSTSRGQWHLYLTSELLPTMILRRSPFFLAMEDRVFQMPCFGSGSKPTPVLELSLPYPSASWMEMVAPSVFKPPTRKR